MCGEHRCRVHVCRYTPGSAPHVRGTPWGALARQERRRFSPACAGNTLGRSRPAGTAPVQPRMCGEHDSSSTFSVSASGSAPHVRGTLSAEMHSDRPYRFSPACAGNTPRSTATKRTAPVQPRMCGEHGALARSFQRAGGSAPHVRGTPGRNQELKHGIRFSPACAGNTEEEPGHQAAAEVQPRMCGEHWGPEARHTSRTGSAPHVRGTLPLRPAIRALPRFSPACAGNTLDPSGSKTIISVQPRMCGEHAALSAGAAEHVGSAPHVRGTHHTEQLAADRLRFSPACAGNTLCRIAPSAAPPVQPRMCGEHAFSVGT